MTHLTISHLLQTEMVYLNLLNMTAVSSRIIFFCIAIYMCGCLVNYLFLKYIHSEGTTYLTLPAKVYIQI